MDYIESDSTFLEENNKEHLDKPKVEQTTLELQPDKDIKIETNNEICRLCAQTIDSDNINDVFNNEELIGKINNTLPIKINRDDDLTSLICTDCENKVNAFHTFICAVIKADEQLRKKPDADEDKASDQVTKTIEEIFGIDSDEELADLKLPLNSALTQSLPESEENQLVPEVLNNKEGSPCLADSKMKRLLEDSDEHPDLEKDELQSLLDSTRFNKKLKVEEAHSEIKNEEVKEKDSKELEESQSDSEITSSYSCRRCSNSFKTFSLLVYHNRIYHHGKKLTCPHSGCTVKVKNDRLLQEHVEEVHPSAPTVPVVCNKCEKIFLNHDALKKHKRNKHYARICNFCWMTFESDLMYKEHMRDHNTSRQQECIYCIKVYQTPGGLRRHILKMHSEQITMLMGDALMCNELQE